MRRIGVASALGVVLLLSACGGTSAKTAGANHLPKSVRAFIHSTTAAHRDSKIDKIDVYGPISRGALLQALGGKVFDHTKGYYLVVEHGNFVCTACSYNPRYTGGPYPGTVEWAVWSPQRVIGDGGIGGNLSGVSQLPHLATIDVS